MHAHLKKKKTGVEGIGATRILDEGIRTNVPIVPEVLKAP
jgi:hypothetical protein